MISKQDLDFEISFYEKLIEESPGFINALFALGDAYTRRGRYKDGLRIDRELVRLRPDDPLVYYNLACSYSLLKMAESCLEALAKAIRLGYRDLAYMHTDPDLQFIRQNPGYKKLLSEYDKSFSENR